jgi:hypothetical protein
VNALKASPIEVNEPKLEVMELRLPIEEVKEPRELVRPDKLVSELNEDCNELKVDVRLVKELITEPAPGIKFLLAPRILICGEPIEVMPAAE